MSRKKSMRDLIEEAATARSDLNIFYAVVAVLESGTVSADRYRSVQRIIAICKDGSERCLRDYDIACRKLGHPYPGRGARA